MRTYKFRGQRIDTKEWVYGSLLIPIVDCETYRIVYEDGEGYYCDYPVIPETVGQFIGEPDKNGKEVYEGDLMKEQNVEYVIGFYSGKFEGVINNHISVDIDYVLDHAEVIGNIHEGEK